MCLPSFLLFILVLFCPLLGGSLANSSQEAIFFPVVTDLIQFIFRFFGEKGLLESKHWKETSYFIELIDSWFDFFNSRVPHDKKFTRNAFGLRLKEQNVILSKTIDIMREMKVGRKEPQTRKKINQRVSRRDHWISLGWQEYRIAHCPNSARTMDSRRPYRF